MWGKGGGGRKGRKAVYSGLAEQPRQAACVDTHGSADWTHTCPNVSGMCRLMARSSAAQQGHLYATDDMTVRNK